MPKPDHERNDPSPDAADPGETPLTIVELPEVGAAAPAGGRGADGDRDALRREVRALRRRVRVLTEERDAAIRARDAVIERVIPLAGVSAAKPKSSTSGVMVFVLVMLVAVLFLMGYLLPEWINAVGRGKLPDTVYVRPPPDPPAPEDG